MANKNLTQSKAGSETAIDVENLLHSGPVQKKEAWTLGRSTRRPAKRTEYMSVLCLHSVCYGEVLGSMLAC